MPMEGGAQWIQLGIGEYRMLEGEGKDSNVQKKKWEMQIRHKDLWVKKWEMKIRH